MYIIGSSVKLELNRVYFGALSDANGHDYDLPFFVLASATKEEYLNFCKEHETHYPVLDGNELFYKVSIN